MSAERGPEGAPARLSWSASRPLLGLAACIAIWALAGPLGAGAAASGRWGRACAQAGLLGAGLAIFADGYATLWGSLDGAELVAEALADGRLSSARALASAALLAAATLVWAQELWLMPGWHGKSSRNPLLGDPD